jgi:DNA-binding transcriptional regulator/RsmH inhibitor MraZ
LEENGKILSPTAPDAPSGVFRVTVDEKGRLKLPADIVEYLDGFKEQRKVFITTFDGAEARLYPIPTWRETQKALQEPGDDFEYRESLAMLAADNGQNVVIDGQGRLTLPAELRKAMSLEGDEVRLRCHQGRINMLGSAEYERRLAAAKTHLPEGLKWLQRKAL